MDDEFRFPYDPGTLVYGRGCVARLESEVRAAGAERALVVTGRTVGSTDAVMGPVREGLGARLAGVFAETTPEKRLATAADAAAALGERDADALVAVGGGSSLDVAKVAAVLAATDRGDESALAELAADGSLAVPETGVPPILAVPTTLAGADLSVAAGLTAESEGDTVRGGVFDAALMPAALCYDPALVETTPHEVLCASAMNGFDKGIESLYAATRTPVTDATAARGLRLLAGGLPRLGGGERDDETLHDALVGTMLVQYGASRGDGVTLSVIHAFGHGLTRGYDLQQGAAHGAVAPAVLRDIFAEVDGRRGLMAEALGAGDHENPERAVVERVAAVRDALGLPGRLRDTPVPESDLPDVAAAVRDDGIMANRPPGYDPSVGDIEAILREAW